VEGPLRQFGGQPGLRLIETMQWDGTRLARLPLHLARLAAGAEALGWQMPEAAVHGALADLPGAALRVRLTMGHRGDVLVETGPLPPSKPLWALGLASARLHAGDAWLGIKSTNRTAYDRARAALPPTLDEVIFQNERGEVCDGTITTLFFDRGQGMCTPPLGCGVLPGVLRADMLAKGQVREEMLYASKLASVRLWVGNSMRGLSAAVWVDSFG
jgi:4-amino-4-deoxychorismate lyase